MRTRPAALDAFDMPAHSEPEPHPPRPSLLMWGAAQRLAAAVLLLLPLWLAVAWALAA